MRSVANDGRSRWAGHQSKGPAQDVGTSTSGCEFELGRRLKDGDIIELVIKSIGTLRDRVVGSGARP